MTRSCWILFALTAACVAPTDRSDRGDPVESARSKQDAAEAAVLDNWTMIGRSVQGRPIRKRVAGVGPRKILWVGGIHGNEREGAVATAKLQEAFMRAADLQSKATLTIVEDLNPDGSAANSRGNANGIDLNRNFPASNALPNSNPLSQPEARVLHGLIESLAPDIVIVAHSWGKKPTGPTEFINYDGPGERLAQIFSLISGYKVKESKHLPPTPGSLGSWVGIDKQVPILTLEYARGQDPEQAWRETREAILAVIRG